MKCYATLLVILSLLLTVAVLAEPATPNYHLLQTIAVGGDGGWDYLSIDSAAQRLYIGRFAGVTVVDVQKGVVAGEIPHLPGAHAAALAPKLHRGFTSNGRDDSVTVFDTDTLKEVARVKVGKGPDAILFDPFANRVFTFNGGSHDATVIDAATATVVGTIVLGGRPEFPATDECGHLFVNIEDKNEIAAIDVKTLTITHRWSLAPGDGPSGLAIDRVHHRLFSVCGNQKMVVMDSETGCVVATPTIGKGPDAAAFDPTTGLAFSSNGRDGTLTVIKETTPDTFTVVATVPTQRGSRTMALDPTTHRIYLAAARFLPEPATKPGETPRFHRPNIEPNSFAILVFGM